MHSQTWASYSAVYRFHSLSQTRGGGYFQTWVYGLDSLQTRVLRFYYDYVSLAGGQ